MVLEQLKTPIVDVRLHPTEVVQHQHIAFTETCGLNRAGIRTAP